MNVLFSAKAWSEYTDWEDNDKRIVRRIRELIKDIQRNGAFEGIGEPEPLKFAFSGYWSRRITREHRLIYRVIDDILYIYKCKGHYEKF